MKNKLFAIAIDAFLVCGGTAIFSSCSKDQSKTIVGEWQRTAKYWTFSGSPNESANYSGGGPIIDGAGNVRFIFNEDKTGMIIHSWFISPYENGIDTTTFSYTIDGDCGVITPTNAEWKANWSTTYTIQDITRRKMVVYEKEIAENCQDYTGDTTPYTRIIENWHHCYKQ